VFLPQDYVIVGKNLYGTSRAEGRAPRDADNPLTNRAQRKSHVPKSSRSPFRPLPARRFARWRSLLPQSAPGLPSSQPRAESGELVGKSQCQPSLILQTKIQISQ